MENKLNLIKTLLNSIVQRWKMLEKLDMDAKLKFEQLINMKDQLDSIKNSNSEYNSILLEIDELVEIKFETDRMRLAREIKQNNQSYIQNKKEIIDKIDETNSNLKKILLDQKKPSSKAGQLCLIVDRISIMIQQLNENLQIRLKMSEDSNLRYALLNYLHKPPVDDFNIILDYLVQF